MTRSRRGNLPYVPPRKDEGEKKREKEEEKRMEVEGETGRGYPKKKKIPGVCFESENIRKLEYVTISLK